jgi:DNA-binding NarL/FixJ family response regulator
MTSHIRTRVFLLSDHRLLREALARALKDQANILMVGTQESSADATAEIIESTSDVLLVDPVNISAVDGQILDKLRGGPINLKIVTIEREAKITDVISAIRAAVQPEGRFAPVQAMREANSKVVEIVLPQRKLG